MTLFHSLPQLSSPPDIRYFATKTLVANEFSEVSLMPSKKKGFSIHPSTRSSLKNPSHQVRTIHPTANLTLRSIHPTDYHDEGYHSCILHRSNSCVCSISHNTSLQDNSSREHGCAKHFTEFWKSSWGSTRWCPYTPTVSQWYLASQGSMGSNQECLDSW